MTPPSGYVGLFIDQATGNLVRKDANGNMVDVGSTAPGDTAPVRHILTVSGVTTPDVSGDYTQVAGVATSDGDTWTGYRVWTTDGGLPDTSYTGSVLLQQIGSANALIRMWYNGSVSSSGAWNATDAIDGPEGATFEAAEGSSSTGTPTVIESQAESSAPPYLRAEGNIGYLKTSAGWMQFTLS